MRTHDNLHFLCHSSCDLHHPDAVGQPEQLRESVHLPSVQRPVSPQAGDTPVPAAFRCEGLNARGGDAG